MLKMSLICIIFKSLLIVVASHSIISPYGHTVDYRNASESLSMPVINHANEMKNQLTNEITNAKRNDDMDVNDDFYDDPNSLKSVKNDMKNRDVSILDYYIKKCSINIDVLQTECMKFAQKLDYPSKNNTKLRRKKSRVYTNFAKYLSKIPLRRNFERYVTVGKIWPIHSFGRKYGIKKKVLRQGKSLNNRPIVGILSQEGSIGEENSNKSYIAASYVKFVESAGARVVPVLINQPDEYYQTLFNSLNGFLFPGGGVPVDSSSGYGRAGKILFKLMNQVNISNGGKYEHKPLPSFWGTCLGFEMILYLVANEVKIMENCSASNMATSLQFEDDYRSSKMFQEAPRYITSALKYENITSNFHKWCATTESFSKAGLNDSLQVISTSKDFNGKEFISTIEHRSLPIYAVQWHPEKAAFEWTTKEGHSSIPHQMEAVEAMQYMANFFVNQARKNLNKFSTAELENSSLIYNYQPVFNGGNSIFEQIYLF